MKNSKSFLSPFGIFSFAFLLATSASLSLLAMEPPVGEENMMEDVGGAACSSASCAPEPESGIQKVRRSLSAVSSQPRQTAPLTEVLEAAKRNRDDRKASAEERERVAQEAEAESAKLHDKWVDTSAALRQARTNLPSLREDLKKKEAERDSYSGIGSYWHSNAYNQVVSDIMTLEGKISAKAQQIQDLQASIPLLKQQSEEAEEGAKILRAYADKLKVFKR